MDIEIRKAAGRVLGRLEVIAEMGATGHAKADNGLAQLVLNDLPLEVKTFAHSRFPDVTATRDTGTHEIGEKIAMAWAEATIEGKEYTFEINPEVKSEGSVSLR